ncbi:MAG: F0F1 ATP synthase subunit alpha [Candidatus Eremiobacterota bacterium]
MGNLLDAVLTAMDRSLERPRVSPWVREVGRVVSVSEGVATATGLAEVASEEVVRLEAGQLGLALTLDHDHVGLILLDDSQGVRAGERVVGTGHGLQVPVGTTLLGRVVDPLGRPLDGAPAPRPEDWLPAESPAPRIADRQKVSVPLQTGLKVVDALIPIGRGQRELILGDRQTGKTSLALDVILNQKDTGVRCIYCAIGQRDSAVARVVEELRRTGALEHSIVVVASAEHPPGLQYVAPYAATAMGEHFMGTGQDVLIVYDDLTRHARAYRELSLLLRRPPGREAFPGDVFYLHARLLERSTHLKSGGSLTALPIVETEAQNLAAYIPTNLISITDGQLVLSPELFQKGILPAVEVGRSVSRVGGDAQRPAYHAVTSAVRLDYAQFEELESFARFDTRLSDSTRKILDRGRRIREVLKQPRGAPMEITVQLGIMLAATEGLFDSLPVERVGQAEGRLAALLRERAGGVRVRLEAGEQLDEEVRELLRGLAREAVG